jgi:hypothetical protein
MLSALLGGFGLVGTNQRALVAAGGEQDEGREGEQERGATGGFHVASIAMSGKPLHCIRGLKIKRRLRKGRKEEQE